MRTHSPFDHRPDPELGSLLRDLLSAADEGAFVARVVSAERPLPGRSWDVLARWARPGVFIGLTVASLAAVITVVQSTQAVEARSVDELEVGVPELTPPAVLVSSPQPPDPNVVLASYFQP